MRDSCKPFKVICLESNEEFILGETLEEDASVRNQNNVCEDINPSTNKDGGVYDKNILEGRVCDAEFNERKIAITKKQRSGDDFIVKKKPDEYNDDEKETWASMMPTIKLVPSLKTEEKYTNHLSCLDNDAINNLADSHRTVVLEGVQHHSNKNTQKEKHLSEKADPLIITIDDDETDSLKQNKIQNPVNNSSLQQPKAVKSKNASHSTTVPLSFVQTITNAILKSADKRLHVVSLLTCLPVAQHTQAIEFLNQSRRFISLPKGWWTLHPAIINTMTAGQTRKGNDTEGNNKIGEQREVSKSVIDSPAQLSKVVGFINPSTCNQAESPKQPLPRSFTQLLNCTKLPISVINTKKAPAMHYVKDVGANETTSVVEDPSDVDRKRSQVCDTAGAGVNQTRKYICKQCGRSFEFKNRLNRHIQIVHAETREFLCSICCEEAQFSHSYSSKSSLMLHIQLYHSNNDERQQCGMCGRSYKNAISLRNHTRIVHTMGNTGKASCTICHKVFASKMVMKRHKRQMHKVGIVNEYTCNECLKTFLVKNDLIRHLKRTHMEPELACSQCPQKFPLKDKLQTHMRVEHGIENRRTYVCDICGKSFKGKGKDPLEKHMLVHKGVKPYNCSVCGKHFRTDSGLAQHARTHSDERRFSCHLCDKAFRIKHHLRQHMAVHGLASTPDYRKRRRRQSSMRSSDE